MEKFAGGQASPRPDTCRCRFLFLQVEWALPLSAVVCIVGTPRVPERPTGLASAAFPCLSSAFVSSSADTSKDDCFLCSLEVPSILGDEGRLVVVQSSPLSFPTPGQWINGTCSLRLCVCSDGCRFHTHGLWWVGSPHSCIATNVPGSGQDVPDSWAPTVAHLVDSRMKARCKVAGERVHPTSIP